MDQAASVPGIPLQSEAFQAAAPFGGGVGTVLAHFLSQIVACHGNFVFSQYFQDVVRFCCNAGENHFFTGKRMRGQLFQSVGNVFYNSAVFALFKEKSALHHGMAYHRSDNIEMEIRYFCEFPHFGIMFIVDFYCIAE